MRSIKNDGFIIYITLPKTDVFVTFSINIWKSCCHAKLTQAAESVRMTLLDHIILADEQYCSFKDNKKL